MAADEQASWELSDGELVNLGLLEPEAAGGSWKEQGHQEIDEFPDVHYLFRHYNYTYFEGRLDFCSVEWSTKRMTLCAGICMFAAGGGCRQVA